VSARESRESIARYVYLSFIARSGITLCVGGALRRENNDSGVPRSRMRATLESSRMRATPPPLNCECAENCSFELVAAAAAAAGATVSRFANAGLTSGTNVKLKFEYFIFLRRVQCALHRFARTGHVQMYMMETRIYEYSVSRIEYRVARMRCLV